MRRAARKAGYATAVLEVSCVSDVCLAGVHERCTHGVPLAAMHQAGALTLWTSALYLQHALRYVR